jgi:hypothetical protein
LSDTIADFGAYRVLHYPRDPDRLIVAFASAGRKGATRTTEEFRNSLWESGVSLCFVLDSYPSWYNHETTPLMLDHVAALALTYGHVGALGHSMGASGAIVFAAQCRQVERVLAFSPQFSLLDPFIRFDERFDEIHQIYPNQRYSMFHAPEQSGQIAVLYGTQDWADAVHAGVYAVLGYDVGFVQGADHQVPRALKSAPGNLLVKLADRFADFSAPFGFDAVQAVLGERVSRHLSPREHWFDSISGGISGSEFALSASRRLPIPKHLTNLARGRATDQSSISRWSRGTTRDDSARAISHDPTGGFAFHTAEEDRPWWSIDFGEEVVVKLVRIYNRMDDSKSAGRCAQFAIEVSDGGAGWREVFRKQDQTLFGGVDGHPFEWTPEGGVAARSLRIRLLGRGPMHYDLVEFFGSPTEDQSART